MGEQIQMKKRILAMGMAFLVMMTQPGMFSQIDVKAAEQSSTQRNTVTENSVSTAASAAGTTEKDTNGDGVSDKGFSYTGTLDASSTKTGTASITGYTGGDAAVTIPSSITDSVNGITYNVTSVADSAFAYNAGITSITMQGGTSSTTGTSYGITTIGAKAFYSCPALTTVTIPVTVTSIGNLAFNDCTAMTGFTVTSGNQRYVSADGALYSYGGSTGAGTYSLLQYPVGKAGTTYAAPAAIAPRLTAVAEGAFSGSTLLTTITLPETVTTIGASAFYKCSALTTMTIPGLVTEIPTHAFDSCSSMTSVTIPSTVTVIGAYAFTNCKALTSISLPENLTVVNAATFEYCSALTEVTVPSKVTSIGDLAFAYCSALKKATIGATTTTIGTDVFLGDASLTLYCHSGSTAASYAASNSIGKVLTYTVKFYSDAGTLLSAQEVVYGASATAPEVASRDGYALTWSSTFTNVTSDLTVTATWNRVYTVTFIDKYKDRTTTDKVTYGSDASAPAWTVAGYKLVWSRSFDNITTDITVYARWKDPATGFVITENTIKPKSKGSTFTKGTGNYKVTSGSPQSPTVQYVSCTDATLTSATVPSTVRVGSVTYKVTTIAAKAWNGNTNLTSINIGKNVTVIGSCAFNKCSKLKKVTLYTKKLKSIGSKAFYGIKSSAVIYAYQSKLNTYGSMIKNSKISTTIIVRAL